VLGAGKHSPGGHQWPVSGAFDCAFNEPLLPTDDNKVPLCREVDHCPGFFVFAGPCSRSRTRGRGGMERRNRGGRRCNPLLAFFVFGPLALAPVAPGLGGGRWRALWYVSTAQPFLLDVPFGRCTSRMSATCCPLRNCSKVAHSPLHDVQPRFGGDECCGPMPFTFL
jgi:hypothetical protein